jgi:hypothetical protein
MNRRGTIFDNLRQQAGHNGAWKSPSPQGERPTIGNSMYAAMDSSGLGQAATGSRASRTYSGGGVTAQTFGPGNVAAGPNTDISLLDVGVAMNARAAYPGRGLAPQPSTPLARRS